MASTLKHPADTPTLTVTFDGVVDIARGREAMNSKDFGSIDADSRQAASKRTKARIQCTFILATIGASSARDKVKAFADRFKTIADEDWELILDFGGGETITYVGLIVSEDGTFQGGTGAVKYMGTIDMNVKTETWS